MANKDQQRPSKANEGQQRPLMANDGQQRPTKGNWLCGEKSAKLDARTQNFARYFEREKLN